MLMIHLCRFLCVRCTLPVPEIPRFPKSQCVDFAWKSVAGEPGFEPGLTESEYYSHTIQAIDYYTSFRFSPRDLCRLLCGLFLIEESIGLLCDRHGRVPEQC